MVIHRRLLGILLRQVPAVAVAFAVVACSGVSHGQGAASIGNPLRYRWQAGSGFGYEVDISADLPDAVETYKGQISYTLEGIDKAETACGNSGHEVTDHFLDVRKMVDIGSGAQRELDDIAGGQARWHRRGRRSVGVGHEP